MVIYFLTYIQEAAKAAPPPPAKLAPATTKPVATARKPVAKARNSKVTYLIWLFLHLLIKFKVPVTPTRKLPPTPQPDNDEVLRREEEDAEARQAFENIAMEEEET